MSIRPYLNIVHNEIEGPMGYGPTHWTVTKVKQLAKEGYKSFTDGDWIESPYITDEGIRLIQTGNIGIGSYKEQGFRYISKDTFERLRCTEVLPGDVLICRLAAPVGRACLAPNLADKMITSVDVCILKTRTDVDPRFVIYIMSSRGYLDHVDMIARGSTRQRISRTQLGNINLLLPTFNEQQTIADYLDQTTKAINALIDKKRHLIELLQEKRQALITQAVTKGLDPSVPMKDSGIEWLGEIPEHWEIIKMSRVAEVNYGLSTELDRTITEGTPIISLPNVSKEGQLDLTDVPLIQIAERDKAPFLLKRGDLLFNWRNGSPDHVGKTAYFDVNGEYIHVSFLLRIRVNLNKATPKYIQMYINHLRNIGFFGASKAQVNRTYNQSELRLLEIIVPPVEEQYIIADYLQRKTAKIDSVISLCSHSIEKLQEYRQNLISAAVTGKIDVREEAEACP